eukprot:13620834-Alexandrium_andersonii.AAC.1
MLRAKAEEAWAALPPTLGRLHQAVEARARRAGEDGREARQEWWLAWCARAEATLACIAKPLPSRSEGGGGREDTRGTAPQRGH